TLPQQAAVDVDDVVADDVAADDVFAANAKPTPPSPPPTTTPPPPQELPSTSQVAPTLPPSPIAQPSSPPQQQPSQPTTVLMDLLQSLLETCNALTRRVENLEQDKIAQALEITKLTQRGRPEESQAKVYHIDLEHADKVLSIQDDVEEPSELQEVIEVVTTGKLMTKVVTTATTTITVAAPITTSTITTTPSAARKRKGVVIRDPEVTTTPSTIKSKEELEEVESRALKRKTKSSKKKSAKKQKLDEEVEELKKHLQIVSNDDDDDVYTEATLLLSRVLWSAYHNIYNYVDDLASRENISIDKVYFRADAEQCKTSKIYTKGLLLLVKDLLLLKQIDAVG
nr:hypothetical protein [Tanacetum cinerariifolium]